VVVTVGVPGVDVTVGVPGVAVAVGVPGVDVDVGVAVCAKIGATDAGIDINTTAVRIRNGSRRIKPPWLREVRLIVHLSIFKRQPVTQCDEPL
jgi:hypothetical protein